MTAERADIGFEDTWAAVRYSREQPKVQNLFASRPCDVLPIAHTGDTVAAKYGETGRYIARIDYAPLGAPAAAKP